MQHQNPFDSPQAVGHSNYCIVREGEVLTPGSCSNRASPANRSTYEQLRTFIVQ